MEISATWCLWDVANNEFEKIMCLLQSQNGNFSENYSYINISIWRLVTFFEKPFFLRLNYLRFQSSPFSWLIFPLINFSNF